MGYHQSHRDGFSSISLAEIAAKNSHAYRTLSTVPGEANKKKLLAHAVQLKLQGQWTKSCSFVRMDLSWKSILSMPPSLLSHCLAATHDTLPSSSSNLHRRNISTETSYELYHKNLHYSTHPWNL